MKQLIRVVSGFISIGLPTFFIGSRRRAIWPTGLSPEDWEPIQCDEGIFADGGDRGTTHPGE